MGSDKVIVVTGSSRGIGLGLVQEYAKRGWQVVATCRNPDNAHQLKTLAKDHLNIKVMACDIDSTESIVNCLSAIRSAGICQVDLLINNAGVSNKDHPNDPAHKTDRDEFVSIFNTNVAGPLAVTQAMASLLEESADPVVLNISSRLGSISSVDKCTTTSYQCSKAALNMLTRCQADAYPNIKMLSVNPGWIATDMGTKAMVAGYNKGKKPPTLLQDSVDGIAAIAATAGSKKSGSFWDYSGTEMPF